MIFAEHLSLTLAGNIILDDVSFSINTGEYIGLIGPNGAGKTSLIKTILGQYKPTKGILICSENMRIGYVPQTFSLSTIVPISVREVLRMSDITTDEQLVPMLNKVELDARFLNKNFHTLSGGQQQRVIIARALCESPHFLIFDEPLTGVDYATKIKIYQLLSSLNLSDGMTILFVSHEIDQVVAECDRVLCLNKTMHTGCHPLHFAQGNITACPVLDTPMAVLPVHHHHACNTESCL